MAGSWIFNIVSNERYWPTSWCWFRRLARPKLGLDRLKEATKKSFSENCNFTQNGFHCNHSPLCSWDCILYMACIVKMLVKNSELCKSKPSCSKRRACFLACRKLFLLGVRLEKKNAAQLHRVALAFLEPFSGSGGTWLAGGVRRTSLKSCVSLGLVTSCNIL